MSTWPEEKGLERATEAETERMGEKRQSQELSSQKLEAGFFPVNYKQIPAIVAACRGF